ncbi:cation-transporting P-type ATPase [Patescibacteria group bacterium]|nr:cation-transporting P-type ATPase [Patescibacteria group bacterium]MBU4455069.1 cation-transporting P-type ATPase [Patescibacteria group bacterium]MCG2690661.1 cation-transporting P-type ATPase [Candidatus Parcubacteria bacterium]
MTHKKGLSSKEAKKRLAEYGSNAIKEVAKKSSLEILFRQVKSNYIVYFLLAAMLISFFVGKNLTAYVILCVILLVVFTGFIQEYKAEKAIDALKKMITPISVVIRDGREKEIPTEKLVPGDILILRTGERIPADCVVLEERGLYVNESVLTGESKEAKKTAPVKRDNYKDENTLFMASFVVGGKCAAEAVHTGMNTRFGKIAGMISTIEKELPLQKKINKIAKYMAIIGVSVSLLTGLLIILRSDLINNELIVNILILVIALSVSAFPEGFPVVLTSTLAMGQFRMAKKNAIINRMSIIETLGETTVICSDKTGTITKGEMTVGKIYAFDKFYDVSGVGYEAEGDIILNNKKISDEDKKSFNLLLKTAVLCNDASMKKTGKDNIYSIIGSPTEAALLILGAKANVFKEDFKCNVQEEIPFSSERKMMTVLCDEGKDKKSYVYSKGAPEVILEKCAYWQGKTGVFKLMAKDRRKISAAGRKMSKETLRVLALACKQVSNAKNELENNLVFLGLTGMQDPPREEVKNALILCEKAGIKVKMITGDNKETAMSIAECVGLGSGEILEGKDIDNLSDEELTANVKKTSIFARVRPEHKLRIVRALKQAGEIVTMTGDGVNDAPALKEAHIGVAMGINGTDVSRSVADMILKDDNFATIVEAVKEGRTIFNNIQKFVTYQLSCNFAELLILFVGVLLAPLFGWAIPLLLALHILFMNIVTDNLPAITLGFNQSSNDLMNDGPRVKAEILNKKLISLLILTGSIMAFFTLLAYYIFFNVLGQTMEVARSTALLALIILEIAAAFNYRSFRKLTLNRSPFVNKHLVYASGASIFFTLLIFYSPLSRVFETTPLRFISWMTAIGFAFIFLFLFDMMKILSRSYKKLF